MPPVIPDIYLIRFLYMVFSQISNVVSAYDIYNQILNEVGLVKTY